MSSSTRTRSSRPFSFRARFHGSYRSGSREGSSRCSRDRSSTSTYEPSPYPKFGLDADEIKELLGETFLPFAEVVRITKRLAIRVRDPDDRKFLECAVAGRAEFLVTGDRDLLALQSYRGIAILTAGDFLRRFEE